MDERDETKMPDGTDIMQVWFECNRDVFTFYGRVMQAARRTTPDREAIIEECAAICDEITKHHFPPQKISGFCASAIRAQKTAPTSDKGGAPSQPFSLTEDDPQEGVAFQYAHELVAKRLRGDKEDA